MFLDKIFSKLNFSKKDTTNTKQSEPKEEATVISQCTGDMTPKLSFSKASLPTKTILEKKLPDNNSPVFETPSKNNKNFIEEAPPQISEEIKKELPLTAITETTLLKAKMFIEATVTRITAEGIYVDFNYSKEGLIPYSKWTYGCTSEKLPAYVKPGLKVIAAVILPYNFESLSYVPLTKISADKAIAWIEFSKMDVKEKHIDRVDIKTVLVNKSNTFIGLRGYLKNGLPVIIYKNQIRTKPLPKNLDYFIGKEIDVYITKFDKVKHIIIASGKALEKDRLKKDNEAKIARLTTLEELSNLSPGMKVKGTVIEIKKDAITMQISPHLKGILLKRNISWDESIEPSELTEIGEELEAIIMSTNNKLRIINLTKIEDYEKRSIEGLKKLSVNDIVECKIEAFKRVGIDVILPNHLRTLILFKDISNMSYKMFKSYFSVGQIIRAKIININLETGKLRLSLKELDFIQDSIISGSNKEKE